MRSTVNLNTETQENVHKDKIKKNDETRQKLAEEQKEDKAAKDLKNKLMKEFKDIFQGTIVPERCSKV